jgi:hypothetical protein
MVWVELGPYTAARISETHRGIAGTSVTRRIEQDRGLGRHVKAQQWSNRTIAAHATRMVRAGDAARGSGSYGAGRHRRQEEEPAMQPQATFATFLILSGLFVSARPAAAGGDAEVGRGNAVTRWSAVAMRILPAEPGPILDARASAILHAAMHDAVNGVERRYRPYAADRSSPGGSLDAAVAAAARDVLLAQAPSHRAEVERQYAQALAAVPEGPAKSAGVALGQACAKANLDRRASDAVVAGPFPPREGPITQPVYVPTGKPGDYAFTPPFDQPPMGPIALIPGFGRLKPFAVDLDAHRARGPDDLRGAAYARDLNRVKSLGSLHSKTRTADQTQIALFWFEPFATWSGRAPSIPGAPRVSSR